MPTTLLPCLISPEGTPDKLRYTVSIEDQRASGEAEFRYLWLAEAVSAAGSHPIHAVEGFVAVETEPSTGALVSVVLPGGGRLVVRRSSLRIVEDADDLESARRRKAAV